MTDQTENSTPANDSTQEAAPSAQPNATGFTPEQVNQIKLSLLANLQAHYQHFINQIRDMPGSQLALLEGMKYFETGYFWMEAAVKNVAIVPATSITPQPNTIGSVIGATETNSEQLADPVPPAA